ncbi:MAG: hypothetical protein WAV30_04790 [Microgenomates group bacterium]
MTAELVHSFILIVCIVVSFIFPQTTLAAYNIELAALLLVIFFIARRFSFFSRRTRLFESVIFTLIVLGTVNTTGGLQSPFFFLVDFLLFALALLLEPIIPIIVTLVLMLFFLVGAEQTSFNQLLPIFSLALMTPFAMILGNEYEETKQLKKTISSQTENTFLFMSLMLKNHLKEMSTLIDNFRGEHELNSLRRHITNVERLIDMFEKQEPGVDGEKK